VVSCNSLLAVITQFNEWIELNFYFRYCTLHAESRLRSHSDGTVQQRKIELLCFLTVLPNGRPEVKYQLRTEAVVSSTLCWLVGHMRFRDRRLWNIGGILDFAGENKSSRN
jgi:hypothetical protein